MLLAVVLAGATQPPADAMGRTFFVDSGVGDDSNGGLSESTAWKTLFHINGTVFEPGDRILFKAGTTYYGQLRPRGSGEAVNGRVRPIVIDRYGGGPKPRIDGGGSMPATLYLYNAEYWEINNLEITNTGPVRQPRRRGVQIHIKDFGEAHHIHLKNLDVHDVNGSVVKADGGGAGIFWRNEGDRPSRFVDLLIEGCTIRRCERDAIKGHSAFTQRNERWYPSLNVVIRNNLIEEVPGDGIVPFGCDGALVEHNVMRNCTRLVNDAAAGMWPFSSDNTVIQFNEVSGHKARIDAQGFDSDWNCRNTVIQYNFSHGNEGGFLLICNKGNALMPQNIGNTGTVVRYNLSVNDGLRTDPDRLKSPVFHISGPVKNTKIYNNVVYVSRKPSSTIDRTLVRMGNWGGPWPEDTWFANNIFFTEETLAYDLGGAIGTVFENNLYWGNHIYAPTDDRAIRQDPLFINPGAIALDAYRLRPGSPCIGAGLLIAGNGGRDITGARLPPERFPSLGAFEYYPRAPRAGSRTGRGWIGRVGRGR